MSYTVTMKKAALLFSAALLSLIWFVAPARGVARAQSASGFVTYALLPHDAILYDAAQQPVCLLPASYYVVPEGSTAEGVTPVQYLDLRGYVRTADLQIVDYEPVQKFADRHARPQNDGMAVNLRSLPDAQNGALLATVPASATLTLYGAREGSELFAGAGNLWQYVRYDGASGGALYGYVYAAQLSCDPLTPNSGEKVTPPAVEPIDESPASLSVNKAGTVALIAAMCVPAGVLMLVLFYRPDSKRTPRHARNR